MTYTEEQKEIISEFTIDYESIEQMPFNEYTALSSEGVKLLLKQYKVVWLHDDPYNMHLIPKRT